MTSEAVWVIHTGTIDDPANRTFEFFLERVLRSGTQDPSPFHYEIRFTGTSLHYDHYKVFSDPGIIRTNNPLPFELWNIGTDSGDPSDDFRLIAVGYDWEADGWGIRNIDHPISLAADDPETDWIYVFEPVDTSPGSVGYDAWAAEALSGDPITKLGREVISRLTLVNYNGGDVTAVPPVYNAELPEPGTIFRIEGPRGPASEVTFDVDNLQIDENGGTAQILATITNPIRSVVVSLAYDGSALLDTDYGLSSNNIVIPQGSTTGFVTLTSIDDLEIEADETIEVYLTGTSANAVIVDFNPVIITVKDDDGAVLTVSPENQDVGSSSGSTSFNISSNVSWSVTESANWLEVNPTSGNNDATLTANYAAKSSPGVRVGWITVTGGGISQTVTVTQAGVFVEQASPFESFSVVANAAGPLEPPDMGALAFGSTRFPRIPCPNDPAVPCQSPLAGYQQVTSDAVWGIHTGTVDDPANRTFEFFLDRVLRGGTQDPSPFHYEIRFTGTSLHYDHYMAVSDQRVVLTDDPLPFELWNIGTDIGDPSDDFRLIAAGFDHEADGWGIRNIDHPVSGAEDDPETDWIYFFEPQDTSPGSVGYDAWAAEALVDPSAKRGRQVLSRITLVNWNGGDVTAVPPVYNAELPEPGTIFRIEGPRGPASEVTIDVDNLQIDENGGTAQITATITNPIRTVLVSLAYGGSAVVDTDYGFSGSRIDIPQGSTTGFVTVTSLDDIEIDGGETIDVSVSDVSANAVIVNPSSATITIIDDDLSAALTVSPSDRGVGSSSGSTSFAISSNVSWSATDNVTWLSVNPTGGDNDATLTASYIANTGPSPRTGTITVTGGGITQQVTVTQAGVSAALTVGPSDQGVGSSSGSTSFNISSNVSWIVSGDASWLDVSPASGTNDATLTAGYSANTGPSPRTGTITVTGGGITQQVTVTQAGVSAALTVSPSDQGVGSSSGSTSFNISSNVSWSVSDDASWLDVSPTSGSNDATLSASYSTNESTSDRTATVTVTGGGITRTVLVTQLAGKFVISHTLNFGSVESPASYRLIGLPGSNTPAFGSTFSGTPGTDWTAYWDNGNESTNQDDYLEKYPNSSIFQFQPGRGFWAVSKNAWEVPSTEVNRVSLASDGTYGISLHNGWNIISNPFDQDVSWAAVEAVNSIQGPIRRFTGNNTWPSSSVLKKYEGYYFDNRDGRSSLKIPYQAATKNGPSIEDSNSGNLARILISNDDGTQALIELGFQEEARDEIDKFDHYAPPGLFGLVNAYMINPYTQSGYPYLRRDVRNDMFESNKYDLEIEADDEVVLRLEDSPGYQELSQRIVYVLRRNDSGKLTELVPSEPRRMNPGRYTLMVGASDAVNKAIGEQLEKALLVQSIYPNPSFGLFTVQYVLKKKENIQIIVHDVLGREVVVLDQGVVREGLHDVTLDIHQFSRHTLSSGIYFVRIRGESVASSEKLVIVH